MEFNADLDILNFLYAIVDDGLQTVIANYDKKDIERLITLTEDTALKTALTGFCRHFDEAKEIYSIFNILEDLALNKYKL